MANIQSVALPVAVLLAVGVGAGAGRASGADGAAASDWHGPGFAYYCDQDPKIPLAVHVVKIDRSCKDLELQVALGGNKHFGLGTLPQLVQNIPAEVGEPMAAINGDYFENEPPLIGRLKGMTVIRKELIRGPALDRAFLYIDSRGNPHLTNAVPNFKVSWPGGTSTAIGLNQTLLPGEAVLYSPAAGKSTRARGIELILERDGNGPWLPLRLGQTLSAKVRQVNAEGDSELGADTLVLALGRKLAPTIKPVGPGGTLKISLTIAPDLRDIVTAIGGGPSLVREGKIHEVEGPYVRHNVRHPRTALGWDDKYFYLVVVDGRQVRYSMGMSLPELADYFLKLGCKYALNLDGGASSTTWVHQKVVNSPSAGRLRNFANALVLVRTKNGAGQ